MAHSNVIAAFHARLTAGWNKCAVLEDANKSAAVPTLPFLEVQFPVSNAQQMSVGAPGDNVWREEGGCLLILSVERGSGANGWAVWADELADLFRGKAFDGVTTGAPASSEYDDGNESGQVYQLRIAVPYDYDLHG